MTNGTNDATTERDPKRSRRDLVVGAAGALGLLAAEQLMHASPARAADGDPLYLGFVNFETNTTELQASGVNPALKLEASNGVGPALWAANNLADGILGQSANNSGVVGFGAKGAGVVGISEGSKPGVSGTSDSGPGVEGESTSDDGVHGLAHDAGLAGVRGESDQGPGVFGTTSSSTHPGVHGFGGTSGVGVLGDGDTGVVAHGGSNGGVMGFGFGSEGIYGASGGGLPIGTTPGMTRNGVHGVTDSQTDAGVFGEAIPSGGHAAGTGVTGLGQTGVHGKPLSGGTGVKADPADDGTGLALDATGPVQFEGSTKFALSGIASIAGSSKSASVTNVSLRAGSLVLAMLQNDVGVSVDSAIPDATGSKIMINLNKSVPNGKTAKVAWFIVN